MNKKTKNNNNNNKTQTETLLTTGTDVVVMIAPMTNTTESVTQLLCWNLDRISLIPLNLEAVSCKQCWE